MTKLGHGKVVHIKAQSESNASHKKTRDSWSVRVPPSWSRTFTGGWLLTALLLTSSLAPRFLPHAYLLFAAIGLPWRVYDFATRQYVFFLIDWCYFANAVVVAFLLLEPQPAPLQQSSAVWRGLAAGMYAMADGPLATAIIAWRCSWVLGWADYTVSVLVHLLPGLAVVAHRYAWVPVMNPALQAPQPSSMLCQLADKLLQLQTNHPGHRRIAHEWNTAVGQLAHQMCHGFTSSYPRTEAMQLGCSCNQQQLPGSISQAWDWLQELDTCCWAGWVVWLLGFPILFYLLWQFVYWLIVQVVFHSWIRQKRLDTSYKSLARRAQKQGGGPLSDWVLQGSTARRITAFGLVQLAFTVASIAIGIISYHSVHVAVAWQVVKYILPLSAGYHDIQRARKYQRGLKLKQA